MRCSLVTKRKDMKYWNIPITPQLDKIVEKAVALNAYVSKSDFIRSAVREKLAAIGLKNEVGTMEKEA
jgi:Arc/MetJ-type ribon-helix-helix transcriptional regulator